jgi:hypothetical protein
MTTQELLLLSLVSASGCLVAGWISYNAWFVPDQHREFLKTWGSFFSGWYPLAEAFWNSKFNFWLTRLSFTLTFILTIAMLIFALVSMFS